MASVPDYVYDLDYRARRELCRILDADRRWEELGGIHMHIDVTTLTLIGQSTLCGKSPTWKVLDKYGEGNGTITKLFIMLHKMDHQRAMTVLKPYVDTKYHVLLRSGGTMSECLKKCKKIDLPRPTFSSSQISLPSDQNLNSSAQFSKEQNIASKITYEKTSVSNSSKFSNDLVNINQDLSAVSLQCKMNSLISSNNLSKNQHTVDKKCDSKQNKRNDLLSSSADSVTDNCAWEKMKNVRKSSLPTPQGPTLNGKNMKHPFNHAAANDLNSLEESLPDVMQITYKDILKATDNFNSARILGRGGFGTVYRGKWKGTSVAIKRLGSKKNGPDNASRQMVSLKQSLNELNILMCCRFDHILPLYGVSLDGLEPCLVYQLMVNGSLEDRLLCKNDTPPLTWSQRSRIAECTTKGLNYLHTTPEKPLVHGDIKSANILLDVNFEAKIGDFGLTREGPDCEDTHVKVSSIHGTQFYLPEEYLRHRHLSPLVDVYSYGIVLLEVATGLRPYDDKRNGAKHLVNYVNECSISGRLDSLRDTKAGEENMMWFNELIYIGQICSSKEKKKRPEMQQVLERFEKMNKEIAMLKIVRKVSEDKGSGADVGTSVLKGFSPRYLQIYYDLTKDSRGMAVDGNSANPSPSPPNYQVGNSFGGVSGLQDVKGPPNDDSSFHTSDIRAPPSTDDFGCEQCASSECNEKGRTEIGECIAGKSNAVAFNRDYVPPSERKAPFPLLTVLNMQEPPPNSFSESNLPIISPPSTLSSDAFDESNLSIASPPSNMSSDAYNELNNYSQDLPFSVALINHYMTGHPDTSCGDKKNANN